MSSYTAGAPNSTLARLELNARGYRYDPALERAADLFDTDRLAWTQLPPIVKDHASIYADFRQAYRAAVEAGAIADDRGPGSQKETSTW